MPRSKRGEFYKLGRNQLFQATGPAVEWWGQANISCAGIRQTSAFGKQSLPFLYSEAANFVAYGSHVPIAVVVSAKGKVSEGSSGRKNVPGTMDKTRMGFPVLYDSDKRADELYGMPFSVRPQELQDIHDTILRGYCLCKSKSQL